MTQAHAYNEKAVSVYMLIPFIAPWTFRLFRFSNEQTKIESTCFLLFYSLTMALAVLFFCACVSSLLCCRCRHYHIRTKIIISIWISDWSLCFCCCIFLLFCFNIMAAHFSNVLIRIYRRTHKINSQFEMSSVQCFVIYTNRHSNCSIPL